VVQALSSIDFGTTVSCGFDLAPVGILISGVHVLSEALLRRLITPRGRLLDDPDFGVGVLQYLGADLSAADAAQAATKVDLEFVKDARVLSSTSTGSFVNGVLTIVSTVTAASGPFTLVITLSSATVPPLVVQMTPAAP
jgi:hypothetical protein